LLLLAGVSTKYVFFTSRSSLYTSSQYSPRSTQIKLSLLAPAPNQTQPAGAPCRTRPEKEAPAKKSAKKKKAPKEDSEDAKPPKKAKKGAAAPAKPVKKAAAAAAAAEKPKKGGKKKLGPAAGGDGEKVKKPPGPYILFCKVELVLRVASNCCPMASENSCVIQRVIL
jgi:hypothetical protein